MTVKGSEIFGYACDLEGVRGVGTCFLTTESRTREKFVRVGKLVRIKGTADELHGVQVGLGVHVAHCLLFLPANAMFSGDGSSVVDAKVEDTNGEING
jgi:hypothetical protein